MHLKKVSIIIPVYNEQETIAVALESLLNTNYPPHLLEILIIDGRSTDATVDIVRRVARRTAVNIKIIDNPQRITPVALNLGIRYATGEIIIRADAHTIYPPGYINELIKWKQRLNADNVGGVFVHTARKNTKVNHAIVAVLDSPFGVGGATYRLLRQGEPVETDTVPFGIWDKSLFDRIGLFDTRLIRNQDIELNKRIIAHGGKIYLIPTLHLKYYPCHTWSGIIKYAFVNGQWNVLTIFITKNFGSLNTRHFVPMLFVLSLTGSFLLGLWQKVFFLFSAIIMFFYLLAAVWATLKANRRNTTIIHIAITFFLWHFSYGLGEIWGLLTAPFMIKKINTNY